MSETALVSACLAYLRLRGCMVWRANTGAMRVQTRGRRDRFVRFGPVGQPDIVGYGPPPDGRGISVECKRRPNKLTWAQQQFLDEAQAHGAFAVCVWEIEELIQAWEKRG